MDEKIKRFEILCKRGFVRGLTREENQEFKSLEKSISGAMLKDEKVFDKYIKPYREILNLWF